MSKQTIWKLTKTSQRISRVNVLSDLLKPKDFAELMDMSFTLAYDRLLEKEGIKTNIQHNLKSFKFRPEDFIW